jgi:hypothetical protein
VTEPHVGCSGSQIATVVALDTNHANAFVIDAVEKFCPQGEQREMHDVFIVISEGSSGKHIARTVYAASEDDARQTHREIYAHPVSLDTTHPNGFVTAGVEKCWPRFDHCGAEMHDVFIVISEGGDGKLIARTVYAASEDDARQTHRENYPDEAIVAVHQ